MIDWLNDMDTRLFLLLNGLHHPVLDPVMVFISKNHVITVLIALGFLSYGFLKIKKKIFLALVFLLLSVGASDFVASSVFKPAFERLRPCKQQELRPQLHLAGEKCWGGKYGFASSHASNTFCMALFIWLLFRKYHKSFALLFVYAALVSYSRIYLGKHFPGDLVVGGMIGMVNAWWAYKLYELSLASYSRYKS